MVMQRFAKPCTSVQFRSGPPSFHLVNASLFAYYDTCYARLRDARSLEVGDRCDWRNTTCEFRVNWGRDVTSNGKFSDVLRCAFLGRNLHCTKDRHGNHRSDGVYLWPLCHWRGDITAACSSRNEKDKSI